MVYDDAEKLYAEVRKEGRALIEEAFKAIFPSSLALDDPNFKKKTGTLVGYNTTFFPRRDIVEVPLAGGAASKLRSQVVQASKDGTVGLALMDCATGGGVAFGTGMYADCKPVSGTYDSFERLKLWVVDQGVFLFQLCAWPWTTLYSGTRAFS